MTRSAPSSPGPAAGRSRSLQPLAWRAYAQARRHPAGWSHLSGRRPRRPDRQPQQAPGVRLPVRRDLRRHPLGVGLRAARRRAQGEHQAPVVARDGQQPRRRRRPRLLGHPAARGLGRPPATSRPSSTRWSSACPATSATARTTCEEAYAAKHGRAPRAAWPTSPAPTAAPAASGPSRAMFNGLLKTYLGPVESEEGLHYLRPETAQGIFVNFANVLTGSRARSRRSASPRSARASATRSPRATSSSAPASSSRWRWSSSSSPAPTRSGTSTGSKARWHWYVDLGINPENLRYFEHPKEKLVALLQAAPSTSSTASASAARSGASSRASPTAPTSTSRRTREHSGVDLSLLRPGQGRALDPVRHRAGGRPDPRAAWPSWSTPTPRTRRPTPRAASTSARCCGSTRGSPRSRSAVLPLSRNADLSPKARDLAAAAARALERRVRRRRRDRPPLPPPGRDRHAVLRHGRLRHPRRPGRHRARARHDGPGADRPGRRRGLARRRQPPRPLLTPTPMEPGLRSGAVDA